MVTVEIEAIPAARDRHKAEFTSACWTGQWVYTWRANLNVNKLKRTESRLETLHNVAEINIMRVLLSKSAWLANADIPSAAHAGPSPYRWI